MDADAARSVLPLLAAIVGSVVAIYFALGVVIIGAARLIGVIDRDGRLKVRIGTRRPR